MKFPTFVSKVLLKTAPMPPTEADDLNNSCAIWYYKKFESAKLKKAKLENGEADSEPLSLIDKVFLHSNEWYARVGFTILFFVAVKFIQDLMNPGDSPQDHDD